MTLPRDGRPPEISNRIKRRELAAGTAQHDATTTTILHCGDGVLKCFHQT